jgi:hypothetical protein
VNGVFVEVHDALEQALWVECAEAGFVAGSWERVKKVHGLGVTYPESRRTGLEVLGLKVLEYPGDAGKKRQEPVLFDGHKVGGLCYSD